MPKDISQDDIHNKILYIMNNLIQELKKDI